MHCKAGRGRSATAVVCYLLKHGFEGNRTPNVDEAIAFVKEKRPIIQINPKQREAIQEYYNNIFPFSY